MWIVRIALRRPFTFLVMAALIAVLGVAAAVSERAMTTTVKDIEHIESQSYNGVSVTKVYLQQGAKVELAIAQVTSIVQTILRVLPPGIFPPSILKYDASSVPILQLGLSSNELTESQLYDLGQNFVRTQLATIQGATLPLPYGGKTRQIMVDLNPAALYSKQLSATDVSNALGLQNLILPAGTAKIGKREYLVRVNSSPLVVDELNDLPIKNQILNFGLPAPLDGQVVGRNFEGNYRIAKQLEKKMAAIPGAVDVHLYQIVDYPEVRVNVHRNKAAQLGLTARDVTNSLLISLRGSGQVAPNQWLNPQSRQSQSRCGQRCSRRGAAQCVERKTCAGAERRKTIEAAIQNAKESRSRILI